MVKQAVKPKTETTERRKRILIVDDHPVVRHGVAQLLSGEPDLEVCGEASSLPETIKVFRETQPDLILLDLSLGDGSGIELIKDLKARDEDVCILVSSMHDEALFAERALRAGARGYINKHEDTERLLQAIRHVLGGRVYLSSRMADRLLHRMVGPGDPSERSSIESLSDRELEVFQMIGGGLTTRQIAERLYLSPKTIETYRENIKTKMNLANGSELTYHAVQWVLENS